MHNPIERLALSRRHLLLGASALSAGALLGRPALAAPETPLTFVGWQYEPQVVDENVNIFKGMYDESVTYELVSGDYHPLAETKLIAGQHIDMIYAEEDRVARWHAAGWTRSLEDLPGIDKIKAGLFPACLESLSLPDGRIAALPYYAGYNTFVYNEEHLATAAADVPETWDDVLEVCRKLKADGISDAPYQSSWGASAWELSLSIFACWYAEGAEVFDADNNFVDDAALRNVLKAHQALYQEGLVAEDIMTMPGTGVPSYASGRHTFMVMHDYNHKVANDPAVSTIAGKVRNALMPGATHSTLAWTSCYLMGAQPVDLDRAWNLIRFFGGKAIDGQYHVCKRWALEFGLGPAYREIMDDPDIRESFSAWRNLDISSQQLEQATARKVAKTLWFPEWDIYMTQRVQEYIRAGSSLDQLVDELAKKAADLKAQY